MRMSNSGPDEVTLNTVHEDLQTGFAHLEQGFRAGFAELKSEVRTGFADLNVTLISGFQALPTRESSEEMVRLLREKNRIDEERLTQLDVRIREQHLEIQQVLRAVVEGQRNLAVDMKALVARLDALIRGRGDGSPTA